MARTKGTYSLSANIEPNAAAPLDARQRVATKADLTANGSFPYPWVGMEVYVTAEDKKYRYMGTDPTVLANWAEVGGGGGGSDIQKTIMPAASVSEVGKIYQYIGENTASFTNGLFYKCVNTGQSNITIETPVMTSNTTPSGVVSSSTQYSNRAPWWAFKQRTTNGGNFGSEWVSAENVTPPQWIQYQFPTAKTITFLETYNRGVDGGGVVTDFTLQGSDDGTNWTDIQRCVPTNTAAGGRNEYVINNSTAYIYYRLRLDHAASAGYYSGDDKIFGFLTINLCSGGYAYVWAPIKVNYDDDWTSTSLVDSNNQVTFTGLDDSNAYALYCEDKLALISGVTKTTSGNSATLVYTLSGVNTGDSCKLRILK